MDVSCPKCQTEYELDDSRVTEEGVTVKCTTCSHVFRVKRKQLVVTLPAKSGDGPATDLSPAVQPSGDLPPPPPSREWKLKLRNGQVVPCRDLTMLQKWIIEAKVQRDDEISLTGDVWKRLGDIPELASFFQIVEEAQRARSMPPPPPPPSVPPPAASPGEKKITDTWREREFSVPPPAPMVPIELAPAAPTASQVETKPETPKVKRQSAPLPSVIVSKSAQNLEPTPEQLRRAVSGGNGKWIALVIAGIALGGALGWYFGVYQPEQRAAAARAADQARADEEARTRAAEEAARAAALIVDAGTTEEDAGVDAGSEEDAGTPDAGIADAGLPPSVTVEPPKRTYDSILVQADRLREAEKTNQALALYEQAHNLKPERIEPIAGRGLALLDLGKTAEAELDFEEALKISPRYGPAIMGLAEACRLQGKKAKAIQFYERYLEVLPNGAEAAVARNSIERLKQ